MTLWNLRAARMGDLDSLSELADLAGTGFTNLPSNREALKARLEWNEQSYAREEDEPDNELYILLLEEAATGRIGGSAMLFSRLGVRWPFYSYKVARLSQFSAELNRTARLDVLHLVNDFNGASEVGGLFLHPDLRSSGFGGLLARSRYMFIAMHRRRFASRILAELRGRVRDDGSAPFWDGLGGKFFGMSFQEADRFNSQHGNQFIADLMPKYPIYTALLSPEAQDTIGQPHDSGVPAMRMLEKEGFSFTGYVDIFDAGPTMVADTDRLRTVEAAQTLPISEIGGAGAESHTGFAAAGERTEFRAWRTASRLTEQGLVMPPEEAALMRVKQGDKVIYVAA